MSEELNGNIRSDRGDGAINYSMTPREV